MQPNEELNFARVALKGTAWIYAARYSGKLVVFLSTIILARLLTKDDFGVVGYALVVTNFLDVIRDLGIGQAVIYHEDDPRASDTAFWLILLFGITLFAITWVAAPFVGAFFQDDRAINVTRALAITFPITAVGKIHHALLRKRLDFDKTFIPSISRNIGKAALSVGFAFLGFGVWSLVIGNVGAVVIFVIVLWIVLPWRPRFQFDRKIAKELFRYGIGILSVNVLAYFLRDSDALFIGRFLGATALGVYSIAYRIPEMLILEFSNVIHNVSFPAFVLMNDPAALQRGFLKSSAYLSYVTFPVGVGLALVSRPFILTFFTEKWVEAIPVLQAISIYALIFSLSYNAGSVYKAKGQPYTLTKLALLRIALLLPALYLAVTQIGTIASVGWAHAGVALVAGSLNLYVAARMIDVSLFELLGSFRPALISSIIMALAVMGMMYLGADAIPVVQLLISISIGGLVYLIALGFQEQELIFQTQNVIANILRRGK
ncbi:MAG: lipopolysaccharide biosynthesis protein [Anaerolineales bacterium]|nr:lipopolysaccharide biosynthesis protein [Chloroflexota bacterium]MBL6980972.1 lipopolysaccharide biosynthesis protein [Anaerolineales bacterium]